MRPIILTYRSESQLAFMQPYICPPVPGWGGGGGGGTGAMVRVQNGISDSYMDAIFELVVHVEQES